MERRRHRFSGIPQPGPEALVGAGIRLSPAGRLLGNEKLLGSGGSPLRRQLVSDRKLLCREPAPRRTYLPFGQITGPYVPISGSPATPEDWDCLDGTLYVEENTPWLVFSHEWTQIQNGAICALPLAKDLSKATGAPVTLFHAKDAPWSVPGTGDVVVAKGENYVTDGPFLFHEDGKLKMLWSSFAADGYAIGIAESRTGKLTGPWTQQKAPAFDFGGHGMLFDAFDGTRYLVLHAPNTSGQERLRFVRWN